jgi:hypothetical protein
MHDLDQSRATWDKLLFIMYTCAVGFSSCVNTSSPRSLGWNNFLCQSILGYLCMSVCELQIFSLVDEMRPDCLLKFYYYFYCFCFPSLYAFVFNVFF